MDGDKLAAFLQDTVVGRKKRKDGKKKEETPAAPLDADIDEDALTIFDALGAVDEENGQSVSFSTAAGYVSAIVDLWTEQVKAGVNTAQHPRLGAVTAIVDTESRKRAKREKAQYVDRGLGV